LDVWDVVLRGGIPISYYKKLMLHVEISRKHNPVDQFTMEYVDTYGVMKMLNISRRTLIAITVNYKTHVTTKTISRLKKFMNS
jgi:hypothetical protein